MMKAAHRRNCPGWYLSLSLLLCLGACKSAPPPQSVAAPPPSAAPAFYSAKLAEMDAAIERAIPDKKCPGGVLWLEHRGASYHKAYGQRALVPAAEPMTEDTHLRRRVADEGGGLHAGGDAAGRARAGEPGRARADLHPGVHGRGQGSHHGAATDDARFRAARGHRDEDRLARAARRPSRRRARRSCRARRARRSATATSISSCWARSCSA